MTRIELPGEPPPPKNVLRMTWDILTFRFTERDLSSFTYRHLLFGLLCTWVVGVGRAWHNPRVAEFQHWGLGSLGVVLGIAVVIFLLLWPLRPRPWSLFNVLTFVSLTSLPGLVFAIPQQDNGLKLLLLLIVSVWRVALFVTYLRRYTDLEGVSIFIGAVLPLCLIVVVLTALNLQHAAVNIMSGTTGTSTSEDEFLMIMWMLSVLSFLSAPALIIVYIFSIILTWLRDKHNDEWMTTAEDDIDSSPEGDKDKERTT